MKELTWTPSKVGCYWYAGEFTISTQATVDNGKQVSGYVLTRDFNELGFFNTLKEAQMAAETL